MEVQYDQEPFARPRYRDIVTEARHEEQRGETKTHPRRATRMVPTAARAACASPGAQGNAHISRSRVVRHKTCHEGVIERPTEERKNPFGQCV